MTRTNKQNSSRTFVGTEPHPIETRQSIRVSGHRSCASLMAKIVGLFATIAPSCQRFTSEQNHGKITQLSGPTRVMKACGTDRHLPNAISYHGNCTKLRQVHFLRLCKQQRIGEQYHQRSHQGNMEQQKMLLQPPIYDACSFQ